MHTNYEIDKKNIYLKVLVNDPLPKSAEKGNFLESTLHLLDLVRAIRREENEEVKVTMTVKYCNTTISCRPSTFTTWPWTRKGREKSEKIEGILSKAESSRATLKIDCLTHIKIKTHFLTF